MKIAYWDYRTLERNHDENDIDTQIFALKESHAREDALQSARSGDLRFVGVMGIDVILPGVGDGAAKLKEYGAKVISGTSDHREDAKSGDLNEVAYEYAKSYNLTLSAFLNEEAAGRPDLE
jgi:hypothetical protein